jgi:N-formylglutamate amidohydrolase
MYKYNSILLNIPHSSKFIPDYSEYYDNIALFSGIKSLTDHYTDEIFDISNNNNLLSQVHKYSRFYCDVERYWDDNLEVMSSFGQGAIYRNNCDEKLIRIENKIDFNKIKNIYDNYYVEFNKKIDGLLKQYDDCLIIDCHSFNSIPLQMDLNKNLNRPDICIGFNECNILSNKLNQILGNVKNYFNKRGYSVGYNNPFSGSIMTDEFKNNNNVDSIMIEINKKLYLNENNSEKNSNFEAIKKMINELTMSLIN